MGLLREIMLYFDPVGPLAVHTDDRILRPLQDDTRIHRANGSLHDPDSARIVLAGIGDPLVADQIRSYLYGLASLLPPGELADLGNFREGRTPADTRTGLADVITELRKANKIMVFIGRNTHDIQAFGKAFNRNGYHYNLTVVDPVIDMMPEHHRTSGHYLNELVTDPDGRLFDFVHLGYQSYLNDAGSLDRLGELSFESYRLGAVRDDIRETEPAFRNSDMAVLAMNAIRQTEAPGVLFPSANGLTAEESCQLARFAGLSDRLSLFSMTNFLAGSDTGGQTAALAAHLIWHFLQGVLQRKSDYPSGDILQYQKFLINIPKTGFNLTFLKSPVSGRWWVEVPSPDAKNPYFLYVACSPRDYQVACDGEIPDRWWNHYRRLM